MRRCAGDRLCLATQPDDYRADEQGQSQHQERVIESHDIRVVPDNILDLGVRLLSSKNGVVALVHKCRRERLYAVRDHKSIAVDTGSNFKVMELFPAGYDGIEHGGTDAATKVAGDIENGRTVSGIFRLQQRIESRLRLAMPQPCRCFGTP